MKLFPHQKTGVEYLLSGGKHKYLFDDQGLGKTIQTLTALDRMDASAVVFTTKSASLSWESDLKHFPHLKDRVHVFNYAALNGEREKRLIPLHNDKSVTHVIADECHKLKGPTSMTWLNFKDFAIKSGRSCWYLSGTPIEKSLLDLYNIFQANVFGGKSYKSFMFRYCGPKRGPNGFYEYKGVSHLEEIKKILHPLLLRRTKKQVLNLPDKRLKVVDLSKRVQDIEGTTDKVEGLDKRQEFALEKVQKVLPFLQGYLSQGAKLFLVAHHRSVIDALSLGLKDYNPVIIRGGVGIASRRKAIEQVREGESQVLIGQMKSVAEGLNLQFLNRVCFIEGDWNWSSFAQAQDRLMRIGQKNEVLVEIYLDSCDHVDSGILSRAVFKKNEIMEAFFNEKT